MNLSRPSTSVVTRVLAVVVVALLGATVLALAVPAPAGGASRLSVSGPGGGAVASGAGATTLTVSGSGYQAVEGGFGGVYVAFGWVDGASWGPSSGGTTGRTYDYVPDQQSRDNQGHQAFVAFPGSSTAGEAQSTMGADGSFRVSLTVPGPVFTGAGGKRIDCRQMTCGVFTFGAHGVRNAANEVFTPVTFSADPAQAGAEVPAGAESAPGGRSDQTAGRAAGNGRAATANPRAAAATRNGAGPATASGGSGTPSENAGGDAATGGAAHLGGDDTPAASTSAGVSTSGAAVIEVDRKAARAGGVMAFAAAGFWPGEQVYVVLGDGDAAVGPVVAGVDGEVAGVLAIPEEIEVGTHEIRAAGAGSGLEATERFAIRSDIAPASSGSGLSGPLSWVFLTLSALVALAATALVVRRRLVVGTHTDGDPVELPDVDRHPAGSPAEPNDRLQEGALR